MNIWVPPYTLDHFMSTPTYYNKSENQDIDVAKQCLWPHSLDWASDMYVYSILIWIKDIKTKIKAPHYWTWNLPRLCRASLTLKWLERSHFHFHMRRRQLCIGSSTQIPTIYLQVQRARNEAWSELSRKNDNKLYDFHGETFARKKLEWGREGFAPTGGRDVLFKPGCLQTYLSMWVTGSPSRTNQVLSTTTKL